MTGPLASTILKPSAHGSAPRTGWGPFHRPACWPTKNGTQRTSGSRGTQPSTGLGCRIIVCSPCIRLPANATQFGVTSLPGGSAGRADTLGGNGLAVSRTSAHPREALELIRFLLRRDAELLRARASSEPPKEQELYDLPEILEPYPQLAASRQHPGRVVARPSIVFGREIRGCEPSLHPGIAFRADWRRDSVGCSSSFGEATDSNHRFQTHIAVQLSIVRQKRASNSFATHL